MYKTQDSCTYMKNVHTMRTVHCLTKYENVFPLSLWIDFTDRTLSNYVQSRDASISKGEDNGLATERLKFRNEIPYGDEKNFEWEKSL